jgi:hypothetical protein
MMVICKPSQQPKMKLVHLLILIHRYFSFYNVLSYITRPIHPSPNSPLNKYLLQPPNFPLEGLPLLPTIQRPSIIDPQTLNQLISRLFDPRIHLLYFFPACKLPLQLLNLFSDALLAQLCLALLIGCRRPCDSVNRAVVGGVLSIWGWGGRGV